MSDFILQIKVKNGHLLRAIRARYGTVSEMCRKTGQQGTVVGELLAMKRSPIAKATDDWSKPALDLSAAVGIDPEILWPDHMRRAKARTSWEVNVDTAENVIDHDAANHMLLANARPKIEEALATLRPREQLVIRERTMGNATLEDLGKELGLSRDRVRQIELKALQKLKHPTNSRKLRNLMSDIGERK